MQIIDLAIVFFWFISMSNEYLQFAYFWQLKEYRWDRFFDLLSTTEGKRILFRYDFLYKIPLILVIFFWDQKLAIIKWVVLLIFILDFSYLILKVILKKPIKKPVFSLKVILILFVAIFVESIFFLKTQDPRTIAVFSFLRFILITIIITFVNIATQLIKKYVANLAKRKLAKYKKLTVIGITGSYGKTSTKEILTNLISYKFKVVKTPKNINTDFGISKFILQTNFKDVDFFVVEMGAYRVGDLNEHCNIVNPKIGILTAISPQHLSLFGSIENIQKAKYELLKYLPKNGLAVTNSDNKYCREFLEEIKAKTMTFGFEEEFKPTCLIEDIKNTTEGIICKFKKTTNQEIHTELHTKLSGEYNILNLAPSFLVADYLGFSAEDLQEAVKKIENPKYALNVYNYGKAIIIDDTYNSNPDGFKVAINMLASYSHEYKKIIVTRGIIELGELSNEIHEQIGGEIAFVADDLVITTPDFVEPLKKGVGTKYQTKVMVKTSSLDLLAYLKEHKKTKSVILLENRIPEIIRHELKK
ncbi:MAG: Mur ligase family protein [Candidatus Magasanikbacteria bacterium]